MVSPKTIASILEDYEDLTIATVRSHSSLQIFHGARQEGFKTLGIAIGKRPRFYAAFPARRAVAVPHGSFVEYMGSENFRRFPVPTFGTREVLNWESDREKQRKWLDSSGGSPTP